jgi:hypothetical protein
MARLLGTQALLEARLASQVRARHRAALLAQTAAGAAALTRSTASEGMAEPGARQLAALGLMLWGSVAAGVVAAVAHQEELAGTVRAASSSLRSSAHETLGTHERRCVRQRG